MSLRSELAELVVDWVVDGSRVGYDGREQHENDYLSGTVVPVLRELLDRHPEPVGVELTEGEREILREGMCTLGPHERAIHEHAHDKRLECAVPAVERILAARQAPTVALDVWTCMDALAGLEGAPAWWGGGEFRDAAEKVVAADPRRTEAEVKAEARKRIALAIADSVPYNCELRHDGTEDPIAAAYAQALGDAIRITEGATDE